MTDHLNVSPITLPRSTPTAAHVGPGAENAHGIIFPGICNRGCVVERNHDCTRRAVGVSGGGTPTAGSMVHSLYSNKDSFLRELSRTRLMHWTSCGWKRCGTRTWTSIPPICTSRSRWTGMRAPSPFATAASVRRTRRPWAGIFYSTFMVAGKIELLTRRARDNDRDR